MASKGDIIKEDIQPQIPNAWCRIPFKDGLEKTEKFVKLKSKEYLEEGEFPVVDQGEKFIAGYVIDDKLIYPGELPIVIFGDHTRNIKYIDFPFAVGADGTKILRPFKAVDSKFFYYYLRVLKIPAFGYSRHFKIFEYLDLPIPPLPEQKRIAAKLDELFGHLDALKSKLDGIPELLKNFRQQVLTQAVTGKLTGREFDFKELSEFGLLIQTGPFGSALHKKEYIVDGIPVINPSHINNGKIDPDYAISVSKKKFEELKRWKLNVGDVIVGRRGEMGRAAVFNSDQTMLCGTGSLLLKTNDEINSNFLCYYLRSPVSIAFLEKNSVGSTMINLNQRIIRSLPFPRISTSEQSKVIAHLESLFEVADKMEAQYQSLKNKIDTLPQAILNKAFKGELVPQNPNDEPASVLLERVKKEKGGKK